MNTKQVVFATNGKAYYITSLKRKTVRKIMSVAKPILGWRDEAYESVIKKEQVRVNGLSIHSDSLILNYLKKVS